MNVNLVLNPSLHMKNKVFLAKIYRWNGLHSWFEVHKTFVPEKNIEYIYFLRDKDCVSPFHCDSLPINHYRILEIKEKM